MKVKVQRRFQGVWNTGEVKYFWLTVCHPLGSCLLVETHRKYITECSMTHRAASVQLLVSGEPTGIKSYPKVTARESENLNLSPEQSPHSLVFLLHQHSPTFSHLQSALQNFPTAT